MVFYGMLFQAHFDFLFNVYMDMFNLFHFMRFVYFMYDFYNK